VVAGGKRQHPARARAGVELREGVERAPELEGAGALQVLALEERGCANPLVDEARGRNRCAVHPIGEPRGGSLDVGKRDVVGSRVCGASGGNGHDGLR